MTVLLEYVTAPLEYLDLLPQNTIDQKVLGGGWGMAAPLPM